MSFFPSVKLGVCNAWLFMIVFPLQWLLVVVVPRHIVERTGHPAELQRSGTGKTMARLTEIVWIGASLYSIFLPLAAGTAWLYAGLAVFLAGVAVLAAATWTVARTPAGQPFRRGVYRLSRHPMYFSMILVYSAVSVAAVSAPFVLITAITLFLQRFQMVQEEKYCAEKFGQEYIRYRDRTPRWIGIPGRK
jgi:protein-S-isoprenylcysteine O-methyltransferase Ste14